MLLLVDYGKVLWPFVNELQQNSDTFSKEEYILGNILTVFVVDSSRLHLTYEAFCLLSVIHKQQVKQYNYFIDQSELPTRFLTDFTSSVWNFCRSVADVPPGELLAARSTEKRLYSQATLPSKHYKCYELPERVRESWDHGMCNKQTPLLSKKTS